MYAKILRLTALAAALALPVAAADSDPLLESLVEAEVQAETGETELSPRDEYLLETYRIEEPVIIRTPELSVDTTVTRFGIPDPEPIRSTNLSDPTAPVQ